MTFDSSDQRDPGTGVGAGVALPRLIDEPVAQFAQHVWGRRALLSRAAGDFSDLFSSQAVDELISRRGLRTPFLRMAKDGATLPESRFTAPAGVGATIGDQLNDTTIWRQFADGATIVLQALQRTWAPVGDFSGALAEELGHPVQANAYITPPQNRGFDDHYDVHDVFVLQIEGTKRWIIHEPVHESPLRDQPWTDRRGAVAEAAAGPAAIDTVLAPGDCLYLPRGWLHAAQAQGEVSIHLTLGVHVWTGYAVAQQVLADALASLRDDPLVRASLPLGDVDPTRVADHVRDRLVHALQDADPTAAFRRAVNDSARPAPLGPLAQRAAVDALRDDTEIVLRDALHPRLDGLRLHTRVGWLDLPQTDIAVVEKLLDGMPRTAADVGIALARRLLLAGVVVPAQT